MKHRTSGINGCGNPIVKIGVALGVLTLAAAIVFIAFGNTNALSDRKTSISDESAAAAANETPNPAAPDFSLKTLSGKDVTLSDYKGKVVVVNFWATWCGPCRAEIRSFISLRNRYSDRGLEIIGVSLDRGDQGEVAAFVDRFKINYPIVIGTMETVKSYGPMNAIPTTFVIDRQGRIQRRQLGMMSFSEIEDAIKDLL